MVHVKDVFSEAYGSLRRNRQRSALTMLGMAWGIATVVLLLAYGTGFSTAIVNIFRSFASMSAMGIAGGRTSMQAGGKKGGNKNPADPGGNDCVGGEGAGGERGRE